jgi:tetraacyldisaccharide 4'-kinase
MKWLKWPLFPFALIFWIITSIRNWLFDNKIIKPTSFSIPIINVGNITMGGTGKTPHTEYLIKLLKSKFEIAILSKGYGRKTKDFSYVNTNNKPDEVGDESLQIKNNFNDVVVAVDHNRVNGVLSILDDFPKLDSIILDDSYQHRKIDPGFNILLSDYNNPFHQDLIFPLGYLRESKNNSSRSDLLIVSKCPNNLTIEQARVFKKEIKYKKDIFFSTIKYRKVHHIFDKNIVDLKTIKNLVLVTGIAYPNELIKFIKSFDINYKHLNFRDHYAYKEKDASEIIEIFNNFANDDKIILTTQKDAEKLKLLKSFENYPLYCIDIEIDFIWNKNKFDKKILDYVNHHQSNR